MNEATRRMVEAQEWAAKQRAQVAYDTQSRGLNAEEADPTDPTPGTVRDLRKRKTELLAIMDAANLQYRGVCELLDLWEGR